MPLRLDSHRLLDAALAHFKAMQERDLRTLRELVHPDVEMRVPAGADAVRGADVIVHPEVLGAVEIIERTGSVRVTRCHQTALPLRLRAEGEDRDAVELLTFDEDYLVTHRELIFTTEVNAHTRATQRALEAYVEHVGASDLEATLALFAADCWVEDPVGTPRHEGRAAVEAFYAGALGNITRTRRIGPVRATPAGPGAVAFSVELDWGETPLAIDVIDVMTLDEGGLITSMRAFWGKMNRHERE